MSFLVLLISISPLFIELLNANFLLNIKHKTRILFVTFIFSLGVIIIKLSIKEKILPIYIFGIILIGAGKSLGNIVLKGFMKELPNNVFAFYETGVGVSGIISSIYFFIMKFEHFHTDTAFMFILPLYLLYYTAFSIAVSKYKYLSTEL